LGYYPKSVDAVGNILLPLGSRLSITAKLFYALRLVDIPYLFLVGLLPLLGFTGWILAVWRPKALSFSSPTTRLQYVLVSAIGSAMILATFSYGTSLHLVSNGALAFLSGFIALDRFLSSKPPWRTIVFSGLGVLYLLLWLASWIQGAVFLTGGSWLAPWGESRERLSVFASPQDVQDYEAVVSVLNQASAQHQQALVLYQSPDLYLAAQGYANPTRFRRIIPVYTSAQQLTEIMAALTQQPPAYIIDDQSLTDIQKDPRFQGYLPEQLRLPPLDAFIHQRYTLSETHGRYLIYRRN